MRSDRKYMTLLSSAVFALGFLIASSANAQQQAAAPKVTPLLKESSDRSARQRSNYGTY